MQLLNALIAITGDRNNMIFKQQLTPPEILLLQQLHGADAVLQIEPVKDEPRQAADEIERLKWLYPMHKEKIQNIWRDWPADRFPVRIDMLHLSPSLLKPLEASATYSISAKIE